jgi:hypothetical protein
MIPAMLLVILGPVPLLVFFFAVAVSINHQKEKDNQAGNNQDDDNRLILPYLANKCGHVRIHATRTYTISAENGKLFRLLIKSGNRSRFDYLALTGDLS